MKSFEVNGGHINNMKISVFLLFMFLSYSLLGQENNIEALEKKLKDAPEKEKISILYQLSILSKEKDIDKSIGYAKDGAELAAKINPDKESLFYHQLGALYFKDKKYLRSLRNFEKEIAAREKSPSKTNLMKANYNVGLVCKKMDKARKSIKYFEKCLELAISEKNENLAMRTRKMLCLTHSELKNYKDAVFYYNDYIKELEKTSRKELHWLKEMNHVLEVEVEDKTQALEKSEEIQHQLRVDSIAKAQEIAHLNLQNQLKEQKVNNQRNIIISLVLMVLIIAGFLYFINRQKVKLKKAYELLKVQKQEISAQTETIKIAHDKLNDKNKQITDSINYANRIQTAILAPEKNIKKHLPESFVFFKPRDIVSGDFYWFSVVDNKIVFTAIDCTGHGIPGAFLSMKGNILLNEIVKTRHITKPDEILFALHQGIFSALQTHQEDADAGDGMDMALCTIDIANKKIQYAGAKNPLLLIEENGKQKEKESNYAIRSISADYASIGEIPLRPNRPVKFTLNEIDIKKPTAVYMFSDGFMDQFGGGENKKFGMKRFQQLLIENAHRSMEEQKEVLSTALADWQGDKKQIDDILVVGYKVA